MKRSLLCTGAVCLGLAIAAPAGAADIQWGVPGPGSANWNDGSSWVGGVVPGVAPSDLNDQGHVNNGGVAEISADIPNIGDIKVGSAAGTSGTLNQTGGNTFQGKASWTVIGQGGTGTYNLSGGTAGKGLVVGDGGSGSVFISGTGDVVTGDTVRVRNGSLDLTDDRLIDAGGEIWVGDGGGNTGTLDADSGSIEGDNWIAIGRGDSTGTMNLSGTAGLVKTGGGFLVIGTGNGGTGTLNVSDSTTVSSDRGIVLSENGTSAGIVNQSGGTVTVFDSPGGGDFEKSLHLDGSGAGAGEYNLSGGILNAETIDVGGSAFNMTGGTLSATLFEGSLDQQGGTVSPGNSPGLMTITGNYSLTGGDILMEIDGPGAGSGYDQLIVTGDVSLAGALNLAGIHVSTPGDIFTLIDNQGANAVGGAFSNYAEGDTVSLNGGVNMVLSYLGGDGNDVTLTAVPEPAALAVLALAGLAGIGFRRRR